MAEKGMSLLLLRKRANELKIANYAKYSKEELEKLIEQAEAGITTVIDEEMIASEEDVAKEAEMIAKHAKTVAPDAEDPDPEIAKKEKEEAKAAKKAAKKEKAEKAAKAPKEKKEKAAKEPKAPKKAIKVKAKGEKPEKLSNLASAVYDELLKNDGRSFYQIAKACGTYYTVVKHVCDKHFSVVE